MKKLYLIILMALMAMTGFAQEQPETGDIIYVYQKDGDIRAFLRNEITEFCYGFEDEDGVTHNEPVMQWIVLADSICKIPLANIDSISFVTPATDYQPGVVRIDQDMMQYVERSDSLTIYFAANIPANLLPKIGDKLVTLEMNDKFPVGFLGKVKKVTGTTVECDAISYEEAFVTLYSVNISEGKQEDSSVRTRADDLGKWVDFTLPTWTIDFSTELKGKLIPNNDLMFKGGIKAQLSLSPEFRIRSSLIVRDGFDVNFSADIIGNYDLQETLGLYGGVEWTGEFPTPTPELIKQPIGYGIYFFVKLGAFIRAGATVSMTGIWTQHFRSESNFRFGSKWKEDPKMSHSFIQTRSNFDVEGCVDGSIQGGGFVEAGLSFLDSNLDKVVVRGEIGAEFTSHFVFLNSEIARAKKETRFYEMLKNSEVGVNMFLNTTLQADLLNGKANITRGLPFNLTIPIVKWDLVPKFSRTEFEQCYSPRTSADARVRASGNLLEPVQIGFKVLNKDGNEVAAYVTDDDYKKGDLLFGNRFEGLDMKEDYEVYPVVRINDVHDILASPSVDLEKNPFPVTIVDFTQTGSKYSKQKGFEYDGRNYFYKFNARTTVELSDKAEKIKDWGYIYHDIYGVDKKISCANLGGRSYPDTRYAYYCNEPQRSVELYPYVQYEDETEIQKGKTKIYPVEYKHGSTLSCPDMNHPHIIDLGLPSGTKWACCNLDAEEPNDEGGHYSWTYTKSAEEGFEQDHSFKEVSNNWANYFDFSGTKYDAATVKWGGAWITPTEKQMQELVDNCQTQWVGGTDVRDMGSVRFTGPNGNAIFLPLAGFKNSKGNYYYDEDQPAYIGYDETTVREDGSWGYTSIWYNGGYMISTLSNRGNRMNLWLHSHYEHDFNTYWGKDVYVDPNDRLTIEVGNQTTNSPFLSVRPVMKK